MRNTGALCRMFRKLQGHLAFQLSSEHYSTLVMYLNQQNSYEIYINNGLIPRK